MNVKKLYPILIRFEASIFLGFPKILDIEMELLPGVFSFLKREMLCDMYETLRFMLLGEEILLLLKI